MNTLVGKTRWGPPRHTRKLQKHSGRDQARKPEKRGQRILKVVVAERAENRGAKHVQTCHQSRQKGRQRETRKESQLDGRKIPFSNGQGGIGAWQAFGLWGYACRKGIGEKKNNDLLPRNKKKKRRTRTQTKQRRRQRGNHKREIRTKNKKTKKNI